MAKVNFSLQSALLSDIPAIEAIGRAAMLNDKQTQFKNSAKPSPAGSDNGTSPPFTDWLTNPKLQLLKAVDNESGQVLGSVCWAFRGYEEHAQGTASHGSKSASTKQQPSKAEEVATNPVDRLNEFTSKDFAEWMEKTMPPGTKCMFICAISVHPKFQGHGVGKALIRWGTARADADGVFCWVHASEGGYPVNLKEGFEVDRTLELDLDSYARDVENEEVRARSWGKYSLRYMIRLPNMPAKN